MKYADLMDDQDRADLAEAASQVENGRKLRKRVFARLRARAFRQAQTGNSGNPRNNPEPSSNGAAKSLKEQG